MSEEALTRIMILDTMGHAYSVRPYQARDRHALEQFYAEFEPKRSAQGLPPGDAESISRWLANATSRGIHMITELGTTIVGHVMLMPIEDRPDAVELASFLHQAVRNRGLGTMLNRMGLELARRACHRYVWLSVEPSNRGAIRSYEKAGFRRIPGSLWAHEMEMEVALAEPSTPLALQPIVK